MSLGRSHVQLMKSASCKCKVKLSTTDPQSVCPFPGPRHEGIFIALGNSTSNMESNSTSKFFEQHQRLPEGNLSLPSTGINILISWHFHMLEEKWNELFSLNIVLKQIDMKKN